RKCQVARKRRIRGVVPHYVAGNDLEEASPSAPKHGVVRTEHAPGESEPWFKIRVGTFREGARPSNLVPGHEVKNALEILSQAGQGAAVTSGARSRLVEIVLRQDDRLVLLVPICDAIRSADRLRHQVVPQSNIYSQIAVHVPIVLHEKAAIQHAHVI